MRVCAFSTWGTTDLPLYTHYYLEQIAKWHDEVHILCNAGRPVDEEWVKSKGFHIHYYSNVGRDYQKYHDFLMEMGREWTIQWDSVSLINDSMICYGPLDKMFKWFQSKGHDIVGLNGMIFPLFHVQGSPWMANKNFLPKMWDHFKAKGVVSPIGEIEAYELAFPELTQSMIAMYPQGKRRGWDELFSVPFEDGVPLVKHYCICPRKKLLLDQWQSRIRLLAHPDTKQWQYLPVCLDPTYVYRNEA